MLKGPDAFRTISEVAEDLDLPQHVLRFWETRFSQIKPLKRGGGRRYYRPDDIDLLRGIRYLLYGEGYTIKGVQRILREQGQRFVIGAGRGEIDGLAMAAQRSAAGDDDSGEDEAAGVEAMDDLVEADLGDDNGAYGDDDLGVVPRVDMPESRADARRRLVEGSAPQVRSGGMGGQSLAAGDVERLQTTLAELLECKRLLDQVR